LALSRSQESSRKLQTIGAIPIEGDLLIAGSWQSQAMKADYVVHLAQPEFIGGRITNKRAKQYNRKRALMDANLFSALDSQLVKRIIYVSGTCYYGNLGTNLSDETATPQPCSIGRFIVDIVGQLNEYLKEGMPIVTTFPGVVYGPGSSLREYIFTPLEKGKRIISFGGTNPFFSPIHVRDCGRAIVHLLDHGDIGERYFLVDDKPVQWRTIQTLTAKALGVKPRFLTLPRWLMSIFLGRIMAEGMMEMNSVLSNAKLKALGFEFQYPTVETGIPAVVSLLRNRTV
jgi:nucleoside-diphosphate-sugar epimerase